MHASAFMLAEQRATQTARELGARRRVISTCKAWHKQTSVTWKVNVNTVFFRDIGQTGVGMVIRNDSGAFVAGRTLVISGCMDVEVGETMNFFEAFSWLEIWSSKE